MEKQGNEAELVPIEEAARTLGTTALSVLMHVKRGLLTGEEVDGRWHITASSLVALKKKGSGPKGGTLCRSGCASKAGGCGSCG